MDSTRQTRIKLSKLFIVATPIGNLEDLTRRAERVLRSVPTLVAEDTRVARKLMDSIDAKPKTLRFHRHSSPRDVDRVIEHLDAGDVALVSDAGTPGINDPGQALVRAALDRGHEVVPVPGPSSITAALSASGFYADQFASYGFLPAGNAKRRRLLKEISAQAATAVFFETPHRLLRTLADMASLFEAREIVVCRELTKLHEEIWHGTASDALEHFSDPRGEFVIVVAPLDRKNGTSEELSETEVESRIREAVAGFSGTDLSRRDLATAVAERTGLPRRQVYRVLHDGD